MIFISSFFSSWVVRLLFSLSIGVAGFYGGAYLLRVYKEQRQVLFQKKQEKINQKNIKKPCAYSFDKPC